MLINSGGKEIKKKKWEKLPYIIIQKNIYFFLFFNVFGKKYFTKAALILLRIHVLIYVDLMYIRDVMV